MPLRQQLSDAMSHIQGQLFPWLRAEVGPLTEAHERFVVVLGMTRIEAHVPTHGSGPGRPTKDRHALARAFVAKAVLDLPETCMLIDRLAVDQTLRRLCGWPHAGSVPSEATFSRAFAEFADSQMPSRVHEALIERTLGQQLVGHVSIDATAIEAREKPARFEKPLGEKQKRKRGRPGRDEVVAPKKLRRLERQATMTLPQMLADLPSHCSVGTKRNAKGHTTSWIGYKLHIATADGDVPVACVLTSAHVHDSQVAIPLAKITAARVTNLYDLMDSAYDAPEIADHSRALGHVPIIDHKTRRGEKTAMEAEARAKAIAHYRLAEDVRYNQRSSAERANSNLKDNCGGNHVRVRGAAKVLCHLMLGILVTSVEQLMRLAA